MDEEGTSGLGIIIYAELLSNIRQISVALHLDTSSVSQAKIEILEDGHLIQVHHDGQTRRLTLPAQTTARGSIRAASVDSRGNCGTIRLPANVAQPQSGDGLDSELFPWSSPQLKVGASIRCARCSSRLVEDGVIGGWKDLPSENWAEMMEFWHCHKPHDTNGLREEPAGTGYAGSSTNGYAGTDAYAGKDYAGSAEGPSTQKGYAANNLITAKKGIGFADLSTVMLSELDCSGLLFSALHQDLRYPSSTEVLEGHPSSPMLQIFCSACEAEVGLYHTLSSSVSLFKWQISCDSQPPQRTPSSSECLAAILSTSISRSGSSKAVVLPPHAGRGGQSIEDGPGAIHVWVLNPRVVYASSLARPRGLAMKVLWKAITLEEGLNILEPVAADAQEVTLPEGTIQEIGRALLSQTQLLPPSERLFQGWKVSLLQKWEDHNQ